MRRISSCPTSRDLANVDRHGGDSRGRPRRSPSIRWAARASATGSRSIACTVSTSRVVNKVVDPTFAFMTVDHDGRIRMDCSSAYAMARLVQQKDRYRVAFANDPDADRHGIVMPSAGLLNPNHYLAVAIRYLLTHRPQWPGDAAIGKTLVSSGMIDRVVASLGRTLPKCPSGSSGSSAGSPRRIARLRRRGVAPGRASSRATAASGPPTRTESS